VLLSEDIIFRITHKADPKEVPKRTVLRDHVALVTAVGCSQWYVS